MNVPLKRFISLKYRSPKYILLYFKLKIKSRGPSYVIKGHNDILYCIDPDSLIDSDIAKYRISRDWIVANSKYVIPKKGIVFDVGANVGTIALPLSKISKKVYAFEPDSDIFTKLQYNVELNSEIKNIIIVPLALTNNSSKNKVEFYKRASRDGNCMVNSGISGLKKMPFNIISTSSVYCSTIDDFMKDENIQCIDFIKIDVEGSEYDVLKGAVKAIEDFKPIIIYECSNMLRKRLKSEYTKQSFELLQKLGYIQFEIVDESYLKKLDGYNLDIETNIIAFHKNMSYREEIRSQMIL